MARILLIRHAQSVWNADGRMQGWADPPLSAAGVAQARAVGARLSEEGHGPVVGLLSSDLQRAVQTAYAVADALGLGPSAVDVDARLRERDVGWVTGLDEATAVARYPHEMAQWRGRATDHPPGGEGDASLLFRARRALDDASRRVDEGPDGVWVAVSHGGLMSVLERAAELGPGGYANLSGRWVVVDAPGRWRLGTRFP